MKYHITDDGPKPCEARKINCKYGSHYEDKNSADKAFAKTFDKAKNNSLKGTKKSNTQKSAEFKNIQNKEQKEYTLPIDESISVNDVSIIELIDAGYIVEPPYDPEYDAYAPDKEYDNEPDPDYIWEDTSSNTIDPETAKIIAEENQEENKRYKN